MTTSADIQPCKSCHRNPRGLGGRLSRCIPCLRADVEAERQLREARQACTGRYPTAAHAGAFKRAAQIADAAAVSLAGSTAAHTAQISEAIETWRRQEALIAEAAEAWAEQARATQRELEHRLKAMGDFLPVPRVSVPAFSPTRSRI